MCTTRTRTSIIPIFKLFSGSIQPELYRQSGSVIEHISSTDKSAPPVARLTMQLEYNHAKSDLIVTIGQS